MLHTLKLFDSHCHHDWQPINCDAAWITIQCSQCQMLRDLPHTPENFIKYCVLPSIYDCRLTLPDNIRRQVQGYLADPSKFRLVTLLGFQVAKDVESCCDSLMR
jgi:hypothetical protein